MRKSFVLFLFVVAFSLPLVTSADLNSPASTTVATSTTLSAPLPEAPAGPRGDPVRLIIPSISLDDAIIPVGVNSKKEMDVPSGKTSNIGWYKYGTTPGDVGSAVLDAHIFAAFAKLKYVPVGADIYVVMQNGEKLHFVVQEAKNFMLADLTSDELFYRHDARRLNLITCAGTLTPDHSTYTERLVVFATLSP